VSNVLSELITFNASGSVTIVVTCDSEVMVVVLGSVVVIVDPVTVVKAESDVSVVVFWQPMNKKTKIRKMNVLRSFISTSRMKMYYAKYKFDYITFNLLKQYDN